MSHCGGRTRGRCVQFEFTPIPPMSLLFDSFGIPGSLSISIAFTQSLEDHGWSVDTEIEHPSGPPLEELQKTDQEDDELVTKQLQEFASEKKALILRNSHTGGHRYAGNCIVSKLFISSSLFPPPFPSATWTWFQRSLSPSSPLTFSAYSPNSV